MGRVTRIALQADIAVIGVVLGLAACARPSSDSARAERPATAQTTTGPTTTTGASTGATARPAPAIPVKGGKIAADLGIETKGGMFTPLIERGATVPAKHSEIFSTAEDNQTTIPVAVYWGVSDRVAGGQLLGRYTLTVPEPQPKGVPQLSVTFQIDGDGAFQLTATDSATGAPVTVSRGLITQPGVDAARTSPEPSASCGARGPVTASLCPERARRSAGGPGGPHSLGPAWMIIWAQ